MAFRNRSDPGGGGFSANRNPANLADIIDRAPQYTGGNPGVMGIGDAWHGALQRKYAHIANECCGHGGTTAGWTFKRKKTMKELWHDQEVARTREALVTRGQAEAEYQRKVDDSAAVHDSIRITKSAKAAKKPTKLSADAEAFMKQCLEAGQAAEAGGMGSTVRIMAAAEAGRAEHAKQAARVAKLEGGKKRAFDPWYTEDDLKALEDIKYRKDQFKKRQMNQKMGIEGRKAMGWEEPKAGPPPYYYSQGYMHQHQPKKAKKHADAEC